jgi:pyruvate/2-oxoglutarate dehydrogenase complex dihydrolipoamide dehydrogenase (E3) component
MQLAPQDQHNQTLVDNTHPADWRNPTPAGRYNLVAIGGGTAGLVSAIGAAGLGGKAALVERHLLGGDCLNYGCVPSKALIRAARAAHEARTADRFGYHADAGQVAFAEVMERMRRLRAGISHHDSAARFTKEGVDVYLGRAQFTGRDTLEVDGQTLQFRKAVIATGARAFVPPIPGLGDAGCLTNESVFSLTELPRRLIVIGGGPIGSELGQAMRRFGCEVHIVDTAPHILSKEDPAAAAVVQAQFIREGTQLHLQQSVVSVAQTPAGKQVTLERDGQRETLTADEILVAVGRAPNTDGLGLEAAGVEYDRRGVSVNDKLQTTNSNIYAAGDICSVYKFTHAADAMARICIQNGLFPGPNKQMSKLVIPRCTYTDPEVAHVGQTAEEARKDGIEVDSYRVELTSVDRAILDGEDEGFAVVHTRKGKGTIVGATIVGTHAGEMIGEVTLAMTSGLSLGAIGETIHCYPTQVEVLKRIADSYARTRLTPLVAGVLKKWLAWRR